MNVAAPPATPSLTPPWLAHLTVSRLLTGAALALGSIGVVASFENESLPLFWLSFLTGLTALVTHAVATRSSDGARWLAIAGVGFWFFVPRFLLSPSTPLFRDELAHWSATDAALRSEQLFRSNLINPNIRLYPGLEAVASGLVSITGLPIWHVAVVLIAVWKVAALVAVALIALRLGMSMQSAAVAAVVYAIGPAFLSFDSQFAAEPWALTSMLWAVVAVLNAFERSNTPAQTNWWLAVGGLATIGAVASDFLTGVVLLGMLAMVLLGRAPSRLSSRRLSPAVVLFVVFDIVLVYEILIGGGDGVGQLFSGDDGWHRPFAADAPWYEQAAAVLAPLVLLAVAAVGAHRLWRQPRRSTALVAMGAFGLVFFVSLPLLLIDTLDDAARRSWSFTFLGLSLLVAVALSPQWSTKRPAWLRDPRAFVAAGVVALSVVVVGNATVGADFDRRFRGDDTYGSAQSITDEQIDLANWIETMYGPGTRVVADHTTSAALAAFGRLRPAEASDELPVWQLFMEPLADDGSVLMALRDNGYQLLVIDRRMASEVPTDGFYFSSDEPDTSITPAALDRLASASWLRPVLSTEHLTVYAFEFDAVEVGS